MLTALFRCLIPLILLASIVSGSTRDQLVVDTTAARRAPAAIGLNLNYLVDAPLTAGQLGPLGARVLRYPGGEKSDTNLWGVPPFEAPDPQIARLGPNQWPGGDRSLINADGSFVRPPLDFDQFLALCAATGATPIVVVPFDSAFAPATPGGTAPTYEQLKETAVAWVRYAAGRVPYWEIGNESYLGGYNGSPSAQQYAAGVLDFATAMKAADPNIQIGANGSGPDWWQVVYDVAGDVIDFFVVHNYPVWGWQRYADYKVDTRTLTYDIDRAAAFLDVRHARQWIAVTEFGALTWNAWPAINDAGHAVLLADMIGAQTQHPRVRQQLLWTTRWQAWNWPAGDTLPAAFASDGTLRPSGQVLAAWSAAAAGASVLPATGTTTVRAYAMRSVNTLRIVLINRATSSRDATLTLRGASASAGSFLMHYAASDTATSLLRRTGTVTVRDGQILLTLKPLSMTVITVPGA